MSAGLSENWRAYEKSMPQLSCKACLAWSEVRVMTADQDKRRSGKQIRPASKEAGLQFYWIAIVVDTFSIFLRVIFRMPFS